MDDLSASLPQLGIILAFAVAGTVFLIQKAKMLICRHFRGAWTQKVLTWVWLGASVVIPFAIVLLMLQPWMQSWLNTLLPASMRLQVSPPDVFATGFSAVLGSNGAYAAAKKLGLAADYSPGGPLDVSIPAPEVPMETSTAPMESSTVSMETPMAATEAVTPAPVASEVEGVVASLLYDVSGSPVYVLLTGHSGKQRTVKLV